MQQKQNTKWMTMTVRFHFDFKICKDIEEEAKHNVIPGANNYVLNIQKQNPSFNEKLYL